MSARKPLLGFAALILVMAVTESSATESDIFTPQMRLDIQRASQEAFLRAARINPIELDQLILEFLPTLDEEPSWAMGASDGTRQIKWSSYGVEDCGDDTRCRRGMARVSIDGKELQILRQRLEPAVWEITLLSNLPEKFPPEQVRISPLCDTVQCTFDLERALAHGGIRRQLICTARPETTYRVTVFSIFKDDRKAILALHENGGSGGENESLTLHWIAPEKAKTLCSTPAIQ